MPFSMNIECNKFVGQSETDPMGESSHHIPCYNSFNTFIVKSTHVDSFIYLKCMNIYSINRHAAG